MIYIELECPKRDCDFEHLQQSNPWDVYGDWDFVNCPFCKVPLYEKIFPDDFGCVIILSEGTPYYPNDGNVYSGGIIVIEYEYDEVTWHRWDNGNG
jgi:hypothetical protein